MGWWVWVAAAVVGWLAGRAVRSCLRPKPLTEEEYRELYERLTRRTDQ